MFVDDRYACAPKYSVVIIKGDLDNGNGEFTLWPVILFIEDGGGDSTGNIVQQ